MFATFEKFPACLSIGDPVFAPASCNPHDTESRVTVPRVNVETCAALIAVPVAQYAWISDDCAVFPVMLIPVNTFHVGSLAPAVGGVIVTDEAALLWAMNTTNTSVVNVAFVHVTDGLTVVAKPAL